MGAIHFNSQKERLDYLKGNYEEIKPTVAKFEEISPEIAIEEPKKVEEEPKKAKKAKKKAKKEDENGEIQTE